MALLPDTAISATGTTLKKATIQPCDTYEMLVEEERVYGDITTQLAAVEQACYKILNTERGKHIIYSWGYGIHLKDLFGKPMPYCLPEIPRRITEALLYDDRIEDVTDFDVSYKRNGDVLAKFKVVSIYGEIFMQKGVKIRSV